eukprot:gnl/Hemi2/501_TR178_c0_g1_i1.p1 gnl/Hemi2/501_TR178_c0_g1~~gnl/Hemi2/501_TR178_c0_g1_i1.p1  ORF type:complete len:278 (-),score=45.85 gnl/Hemi2/501_TR178_c0_g1_i1:103-936(-)
MQEGSVALAALCCCLAASVVFGMDLQDPPQSAAAGGDLSQKRRATPLLGFFEMPNKRGENGECRSVNCPSGFTFVGYPGGSGGYQIQDPKQEYSCGCVLEGKNTGLSYPATAAVLRRSFPNVVVQTQQGGDVTMYELYRKSCKEFKHCVLCESGLGHDRQWRRDDLTDKSQYHQCVWNTKKGVCEKRSKQKGSEPGGTYTRRGDFTFPEREARLNHCGPLPLNDLTPHSVNEACFPELVNANLMVSSFPLGTWKRNVAGDVPDSWKFSWEDLRAEVN